MELIVQFLFVASIFHFWSNTEIGMIFSEPLNVFRKKHLVKKGVRNKVISKALYPLFCSFCFGFWCNLFLSFSLTEAFAGSIVAYTLNKKKLWLTK